MTEPTVEQINEALRRTGLAEFMVNENTEPEHVRIVREAARRLVDGWEPCPTCRGSGWREWPLNVATNANDFAGESCPDCVDGSVPGPELVERVATAIMGLRGGTVRQQSRAALLASHRGGTE